MAARAGRPTIIDVASHAGVSKSTVSLVLRASPSVRKETRDKVRAAMDDLGYVYNRAAANLRSAGAGLIGLVINDLRNPFFAEFATSLQMALSARGYAVVLGNSDEDGDLQAQLVGAMIEHGVSAMILSPAHGGRRASFGALERARIPAMQVLRKVEENCGLYPFAAPDYAAGSKLACAHLLAKGCRRIAFIGGIEGQGVTVARMRGCLDVLAGEGITPLVLPGRATRGFGREAAHLLAREHRGIDAALCFNDQVALGLLSGCAEIGREVGADLRVVGFDDIEEAAHSWPPLSSVHCDIAGFATHVAQTLLAWLEEGVKPPRETLHPVTLAERASSTGGRR